MKFTAGQHLARLRADLVDLDEKIDQARRLSWMGEAIATGEVPISDEMLPRFVDRLARKDRWVFDRELLINDGWKELEHPEGGTWLEGRARFPGIPKRPPPVLPAAHPAEGGGGSGGGSGGEVVEITLEESAAVRLQTQAGIEYYEFLTNTEEWTKRQNMRMSLLRDPQLRADLLECGLGPIEDKAMKAMKAKAKARAGD